MNLQRLLSPLLLYTVLGENDLSKIQITSIEMDSRQVIPGSLFACLKGSNADGHQFVEEAKERGAAAILAERQLNIDLPVILVPNTKRALAILASHYYRYPSNKLRLIGVTGTNGKTTTTYFIEKILEDVGYKTGRIGTIDMRIEKELKQVNNTTPESLDLHKAFSKMVHVGTQYAVIEVSSHAIHLGRTRGCNFSTLVFTNLSQDHLDYHGSMDEYKRVKGLAFAQLGNKYDPLDWKFAVLNRDQQAFEYLQQVTSAQIVTYGIEKEADIKAKDIALSPQGTSFTVQTFRGTEHFHIKLLGKFNVYNMLAAIGVGLLEGISLPQIKKSLEEITGINGRLEMINIGQDFSVIVDYAHTPDSLKNVLETIKEFAQKKIYCIVGCGGDRDRQKRPLMARIAMEYADVSVFTADNPRSEDPLEIINDMLAGLNRQQLSQTRYKCIVDRKAAIEWVTNLAEKDDIILIAGKGHETQQIMKDKIIPFDDREVARQALIKRLNR